MKLRNLILGSLCAMPFATFSQQSQPAPKLDHDNIKEVIAAMTPEEKVFMVMGDRRFTRGTGSTWGCERLGIPSILLDDGPAGLRIKPRREGTDKTFFCTAYPTATALAATWNTPLVDEVGRAMGTEVLEYGSDILLAPALNIQRDPLAGRNFEYYSEDPLLSGKTGAAMVRGVQSNGVGTSAKHFIANNQETNRKSVNEVISQRALREMYLRGFEIVVKESDPWTIMSSYNRINGRYTAENPELLTTILRDEWGFKGIVMTDWVSGNDAVAQMKSGNDLIMPGFPVTYAQYHYDEMLAALKDKSLDEATLDRNIERILRLIVRTPTFNKYKYSDTPDLKAHAAISKATAEEAMVLLKNDKNTLPLKKAKNVALFGKTSYDFIAGGQGSGEVNYEKAVSLKEGFAGAGFKVYEALENFYQPKLDSIFEANKNAKKPKYAVAEHAEIPISKAEIARAAKANDIAVITIGRVSAEEHDRKANDDYFGLSTTERNMIKEVCEAFHAAGKKVIVVLNIGSVIETVSWKELPDAILLSWQTGQEGGAAVADILKGKVNPSGKLPMSYPVKYADTPASKWFPGTPADNPVNSFYGEGIYVGYRFYETFKVPVSYEFGYGLSYTTFGYSDLKLSSNVFDHTISATVKVTNTGKVAGKEVVQLYLSAPTDNIDKPALELKGYAKTRLLAPGESETLTFTLDDKALASFWSGRSAWIADRGTYTVAIGASSRDIRQKATFTVPGEIIVETVHDVMYPNFSIKDMNSSSAKALKGRSPFTKKNSYLPLMHPFLWHEADPADSSTSK